jgi:hypothetical protein
MMVQEGKNAQPARENSNGASIANAIRSGVSIFLDKHRPSDGLESRRKRPRMADGTQIPKSGHMRVAIATIAAVGGKHFTIHPDEDAQVRHS